MARTIRKSTVYVVTLDGSIHADRASAKKHARELKPKMPQKARATRGRAPRRTRKAAPGGKSWVQHVLEAVYGGAKTPAAVKAKTGIGTRILHPTLSNLRNRGLLKGKAGDITITRKGQAFLRKA